MNFDREPQNVSTGDYTFTVVAQPTREALKGEHSRAAQDYRTWKEDVLTWMKTVGKNPARNRGYADTTLRQFNYKLDQIMRWLWEERGYTTEFTPEDATELMERLGKYSTDSDSNLETIRKTIKRLFKYYNHEKGHNIEWECPIELNEPDYTNRDYIYKDEFVKLYEAALKHGSVKHYNSCTGEERQRLKEHLAQRFEKPKSEVAREDFQRANSFKITSMVSATLDIGLRPIEIERAKTSWVNLHDHTFDIPHEESSKNEDNWKCAISNRTVRALSEWLEERDSYEKYNGTDALWLNKVGNPYNTNSLSKLFPRLLDRTDIEAGGRDLSWYSIRHGVATVWANEENLQDAREQLRHKHVDTTLRYVHSDHRERTDKVNSKWG